MGRCPRLHNRSPAGIRDGQCLVVFSQPVKPTEITARVFCSSRPYRLWDAALPWRFAGQAVTDTPVYVDPDVAVELVLFCKSCCNELKSD